MDQETTQPVGYVYSGQMTAAKAWVAAIGTVAMTATAIFADNVVGFGEVGTGVSVALEAIFTVIGVYQTRNQRKFIP